MQSNDARIIRGAAIPAAVAGLLAVPLGAVFAGASGAVGVALGVVVAMAFFGTGLYTLGAVGRRWPELFFGAAFLIYTTQMVLLLILLLLLREADFLHGQAFAAGVLVGLVTWLAGQVRAHMRLKIPYVVPTTSVSPDDKS